jgi:hypothetical protein
MSRHRNISVAHALAVGAIAGTVGTLLMDGLWYRRARHDGTNASFPSWESAAGVTNWDGASAPGQVGRKLARLVTRRQLPDSWARTTTNLVHWATGAGWGAQYGLIAARASNPWGLALALGPAAWLSSYVVLPLAKVYKPIWDYDAHVLEQDLSAHMLYGLATAVAFAALTRDDR